MLKKILVGLIAGVTVLVTVFLVSVQHYYIARQAKEEAFEKAKEMAYHYSFKVKAHLDKALVSARTLGKIFEAYKSPESSIVLNRQSVNVILKNILINNPDILGVWTLWEPNAFDGKDSDFIDTPESDHSGRLIPYWHRAGNKIIVEPIINYNESGKAGAFYNLPKQTGDEIITEPFFYPIMGKNTLMISLAIPIKNKNNRFLGVVGIDVDLSVFQKIVTSSKPYKDAYAILISLKGDYIAHRLLDRIGKKFTDFGNTALRLKALGTVRQGREFAAVEYTKELGENFLLEFVPVWLGKNKAPWVFLIMIPEKKVMKIPYLITRISIIAGLSAIIIIIFISFFINKIDHERDLAKKALAKEKEQLNVTLKSIGDGVISTDFRGKIIMMNKVAEQLTGWKSSEAQGKSFTEVFNIIHEESELPCKNPVESILSTKQIIELDQHTILLSRDKRRIAIADSGAPIFNAKNEIIGTVLVFRDNTLKQKMEQELHNSQKLESIGILAGGIAHDFNNLLCGVFGYTELAYRHSTNNPKVQNMLNKTLNVIDRARSLTRQLLVFSKAGMPYKKTVDMNKLLRDNVNFALCGTSVTCNFKIDSDLKFCDVDENQIGQVIDNLIINACQAMPSGGNIEITARNMGKNNPAYPPQLENDTEYIEITLHDNGPGIPKNIILKIFDPFFTTKQEGNGLGLATSYSIIKKHDGYISVESAPGKGTTFRIYLHASSSRKEPPNQKSEIRNHSGGKILLMDDEDFILDFASSMLKEADYEVATARNGEEALTQFKAAQTTKHPFIAVILDLTVRGGMGGVETIRRLLELDSQIKVIASSGYSEDPVLAHPQKYGFKAAIVKPYRKAELISVLKRIQS